MGAGSRLVRSGGFVSLEDPGQRSGAGLLPDLARGNAESNAGEGRRSPSLSLSKYLYQYK
jgi:hypothetical protein